MLTKFSYNKSTIQQFQRQLSIRRKALPVLLRKETALRQVIGKLKQELLLQRKRLAKREKALRAFAEIWPDCPALIQVEDLVTHTQNVAGTKVQKLDEVKFAAIELPSPYQAVWLAPALECLKDYLTEKLQTDSLSQKLQSLELARKKTTQKVNLYEKVQIPEFEEAIRKIKRFLEDKQNIATAATKIVKNRKAQAL